MTENQNLKSVGVLWEQYGPYHLARFAALKRHAGFAKVHALEFANQTSVYAWNRANAPGDLITLFPGAVAEKLPFLQVFRQARRTFAELKLDACLLPSYAPSQSLAALLAAKSLGIRTVMMNESHAGTSRAKGVAAAVKRRLVDLFDSALVGGHPQKRYIASLGLPEEKILTGYDAVDNDYFDSQSEAVRNRAPEARRQYDLPEKYFLSLGRFVAKKNLRTLIGAYKQFLEESQMKETHLVMVGSGEEEASLRFQCQELGLPVYDKKRVGNMGPNEGPNSEKKPEAAGVHFYGFRQVEENPIFYALANAFILPSLYEEWGLVVNEAMVCGLPVVVSETAGCAEDLLKPDRPVIPTGISADLRPQLAELDDNLRQNGFLFDPKSAATLARALIILEAVPELRENMGRSSRQIVAGFSCENFANNALAAVQAGFRKRLQP